jgi:hypothetical protein
MNPEIVLQLLQIGTQLAQTIDAIKVSDPQAWSLVEANYASAVEGWKKATNQEMSDQSL